MVLGFERLNERRKRPNPLINFIKPLPGPDQALAQDFLDRVAAICHPIMKANHIVVMSLEEHEPNLEFVGRNFNNGEVIQLVLKAPYTGQWLPFRHVQMVMMHELAHNAQMNHSKFFWQVRDKYANELRELWAKGYTGDGFWARGQTLLSGQYTTDVMPDAANAPASLCGGTYRNARRGKRRKKEKEKVSYAERKQRRILKKFGTGGVALGDDDDVKVKLEKGKRPKGKPRVAASARGRELRAAAAAARFDQAQKEDVKREDTPIKEEDVETESEMEWEDDETTIEDGAVNLDGKKMVKICGDEDASDDNARRELDELLEATNSRPNRATPLRNTSADVATSETFHSNLSSTDKSIGNGAVRQGEHPSARTSEEQTLHSEKVYNGLVHESVTECPTCSTTNPNSNLTCTTCANVLHADRDPKAWRCQELSCRSGSYVNAGDAGVCGACGTPHHKLKVTNR